MKSDKLNLDECFEQITDHWKPRVAAELNGHHVKLAKFKGEFLWHKHDFEDEMFLVHKGSFIMQFRDHDVVLRQGDFLVVPHGVEHCPIATEEVEVILFEPASTVNTGDVICSRTINAPESF
ncbi:MAG: cupin domain-containing protein [Fimbriimonadaceae bacterium]